MHHPLPELDRSGHKGLMEVLDSCGQLPSEVERNGVDKLEGAHEVGDAPHVVIKMWAGKAVNVDS